MSLSDESFPDDDLHITRVDRKSNVSSNSSSPGGHEHDHQNFSTSTSGQSSGTSRETTQSDPVKNSEGREEEDFTQKVRSCQDLHSVYTKRRYTHVKSKVREFIESQKAEEELRKSAREYIRRISIPEIMDNELDQKIEENQDGSDDNPPDMAQALFEKEQENMCLKVINEHLQSSLQDKMMEATRLRRNVDSMRIELMHAKDKAKRHSVHSIGMEVRNHYSPRLSLPTLVYKLPRQSTATQTDFPESPPQILESNHVAYENKHVATIQPISLNFTPDHLGHIRSQIRRRNNSNPPTPNADQTPTSKVEIDRNDSAIDTDGDSSSDNILKEEFMLCDKVANSTAHQPNRKKKRSFNRKWKWIFGSCGKCSEQNSNSIGEQYSQTPLLDSMFAHSLRVSENNNNLS